MTLLDIPLQTIDGEPTTLGAHPAKAMLLVNVASRCGLTPQYEGLERLQKEYADQGFTVLGFPCNQFRGQEPGTNEQIKEFCSMTYGVTFPLFDKVDVKGEHQHPLYAELTKAPDQSGEVGDVRWNFEKFLVSGDGRVLGRFTPQTEPDDPALVAAIESALVG